VKKLLITAILLLPSSAYAGEGIARAEEWVLRRDGAWIVNFLILFAGLYWIANRFVLPALKERTSQIAKDLEDSEKARMEAMKRLSDLEAKVRKFEGETDQMHQDAKNEGAKIKNQLVEDAKEQAGRILDKAKSEIESETLKATNRLRRETVEFAVKVAEELITSKINDGDHKVIVSDYLEKVKGE